MDCRTSGYNSPANIVAGPTLMNHKQTTSGYKTDTLYAKSRKSVAPFEFDQQVADVFQDMISRSVPGYALTLKLIGQIAAEYSQTSSSCFDLGCSLGASALKLQQYAAKDCNVIGIDNSSAMIDKCQQQLTALGLADQITLRCEDINKAAIANASIVVLNYTLQFIEKSARQPLLNKIYQGMLKGGVLLLSEKVSHPHSETEKLLTELHLNYKRQQGYSEMEIAQKRSSLEYVLIAETQQQHLDRISSAGFGRATIINKALNFTTFMATKT